MTYDPLLGPGIDFPRAAEPNYRKYGKEKRYIKAGDHDGGNPGIDHENHGGCAGSRRGSRHPGKYQWRQNARES